MLLLEPIEQGARIENEIDRNEPELGPAVGYPDPVVYANILRQTVTDFNAAGFFPDILITSNAGLGNTANFFNQVIQQPGISAMAGGRFRRPRNARILTRCGGYLLIRHWMSTGKLGLGFCEENKHESLATV